MSDQASMFGDTAGRLAWCVDCRATHEPGAHVRDLASLAEEARRRAVVGIAQADENAADRWKRHADAAIAYVAERAETLTADDVWWRLAELGVDPPREPRALGARLQVAARRGVIANADTPVKSRRPETHGSWVALWRSRVFQPPATAGTTEGMST